MPVKTIFEDDNENKWDVVDGHLWFNNHNSIADAREFADFIYAELAKAEPEPESAKPEPAKADDSWIGHDGSDKCPVPPTSRVELLRRDGKIYGPFIADGVVWEHKGWMTDVLRYRIREGDDNA